MGFGVDSPPAQRKKKNKQGQRPKRPPRQERRRTPTFFCRHTAPLLALLFFKRDKRIFFLFSLFFFLGVGPRPSSLERPSPPASSKTEATPTPAKKRPRDRDADPQRDDFRTEKQNGGTSIQRRNTEKNGVKKRENSRDDGCRDARPRGARRRHDGRPTRRAL